MPIIDFKKYYETRFKLSAGTGAQRVVSCPFHKESRPSLSINLDTGLFNCFGCGRQGNVTEFHAYINNITTKEAYHQIAEEYGGKHIIKLEVIENYHTKLLENKEMLIWLESKRGISIETVKKFQLGWCRDRITIPIIEDGLIANIRRYKPNAKSGDEKVISFKAGSGQARLFPFGNILNQNILLLEGEMDCLLANQLGYPAITTTVGAGYWNKDWNKYFNEKEVWICYDVDQAGKEGAIKIAEQLPGRVKIINLPIAEEHADFTDYFITHKFIKEEFDKIISSVEYYVGKEKTKEEKPKRIPLMISSEAKYYGTKVEVDILVAGKDLAPYIIPAVVKLKCSGGINIKKCASCSLCQAPKNEVIFKIPIDNDNLLNFIDCSKAQVVGFIRKMAVVKDCCNIEIIDYLNIEEIRIIPEVEYNANKVSEYVARQVFLIGHGIRSNKTYRLQGYPVANPKNQYATMVITNALARQGSLDQWKMTPEIQKKLETFQCEADPEIIQGKLDQIYMDLSFNITHIYNRFDIMTAFDLVYYSVIRFMFNDKLLTRGWTECLILGDSRTGKSETLMHMIKHYRAGEYLTMENTTFAGLIGGLQQIGNKWSLNWGKLVLNTQRAIVIDEVHNAPVEEIGRLSNIRSSGIAEIVKIQTERTSAQVRQVWCANPRGKRAMNTYSKGILAIKEVIGAPEDIARFDFAITTANYEIAQDTYNTKIKSKIPHKYNSDLCHDLLMWAWTRQPENITFENETVELILLEAGLMANEFDESIPLVVGAEQRIKIARLSVALACRLFSTIDGETVIVKPGHVEFVVKFLRYCYKKKSMGYDVYSYSKIKTKENLDENKNKLKKEFKEWSEWKKLRDLLLEYEVIRRQEIDLQMGWDEKQTRDLFRWAAGTKLMFSTHRGYAKHPVFIDILKELKEEDNS